MEYVAIDLHLRRSQFRMGLQDGTVVKDGKCDTTRADFTRVFGARAPMRLLVESSTESEWVAQHLESLVLDDPARFGGDAARASAFLGLVPSEDSSAERRLKGHITKTGPSDLRALLVQASWTIWRGRSAAGAELRAWAHALAARRGRRIAVVALARRLSRVLFAMWRDQAEFGVKRPRMTVAA
jgi:hypothetical protein